MFLKFIYQIVSWLILLSAVFFMLVTAAPAGAEAAQQLLELHELSLVLLRRQLCSSVPRLLSLLLECDLFLRDQQSKEFF
jgi:hypothetical protein